MKTMLGSNLQFRRLLAAMVAGLLMSTAYAPASLAQTPTVALPDFTTIVEKADPAVVNIRTTATVPVRGPGMGGGNDPYELFRWFFGPDFQPPGQQSPTPRQRPQPSQPEERTVPRGVGSGFFISEDGYILTNNHVVVDATDIYVTLTDGREFKAKVIGTDERTDVALIKVEAKGMTPLVIGDPKKLKKGSGCWPSARRSAWIPPSRPASSAPSAAIPASTCPSSRRTWRSTRATPEVR